MTPQLHLRIAGILLILLVFFHLFLPRRFHWKEELAHLSLLNRQIFMVHTFFICLVLLLMGLLSAFGGHLLLQPLPLARLVAGGCAAFWGIRLIFQWLIYSPELWRGQPFNTVMHGLFTALWIYLTWVYGSAALGR